MLIFSDFALKTKDSCLSTDGGIYISPFGWSPNLPPSVLANPLGMLNQHWGHWNPCLRIATLTNCLAAHAPFLSPCSSASFALLELFWQFAVNWAKNWLRLKLFWSKVSLIFFMFWNQKQIFQDTWEGDEGGLSCLKLQCHQRKDISKCIFRDKKLDMQSPSENVSGHINTGVYQDFGVAIASWTSKILIFYCIWEFHSCKNYVFLICNFLNISLDIMQEKVNANINV